MRRWTLHQSWKRGVYCRMEENVFGSIGYMFLFGECHLLSIEGSFDMDTVSIYHGESRPNPRNIAQQQSPIAMQALGRAHDRYTN